MKNILSSLNESEKKRILEMHYKASNKQYLSEQKIYKEGAYSYKVENNKYYYSTDDGKTWSEQTKPEGIKAIQAVITKQGGTIPSSTAAQTPALDPTKFDKAGIYRGVNLPGYGSVNVDNRNYNNKKLETHGSNIHFWANDGTDKTFLFSFECNAHVVRNNKANVSVNNDMVKYINDTFCGSDARKKGIPKGFQSSLNVGGKNHTVVMRKYPNDDIVTLSDQSDLWFASHWGEYSCSTKEFTKGKDIFEKASLKERDGLMKAINKTLCGS